MSSNKSDSFLCDFGINSAEALSNAGIKSAQVLSSAIATASEGYWKHKHSVPEHVISDSIVLSTSIGAILLFSASVFGIVFLEVAKAAESRSVCFRSLQRSNYGSLCWSYFLYFKRSV
jgi:hypothetical protein